MKGIYEYSGIQRCGKSTKMVADYETKLRSEYEPDRVYVNFRIFIDGIHCLSTESLIEAVFKLWADKVRHIVLIFDEVGQFMIAREYKDKRQTRFVNSAWQMPKRDWIMMYASNVGNSADVILRDATWVTVLPHYRQMPDREDDFIVSDVIFNYEARCARNIILPGVWRYQQLFDSDEPIE